MSLLQTLKKTPAAFNEREEYRMFFYCALIGFLSSIITFKLLDGFPYEMGKNLIGVFIPPFIAIFYLTYTGSKYKLDRKLLIRTLLLYFIQIIPFLPLSFQEFQPTPASDYIRYFHYAKNMFENQTLWGGDQIFYTTEGKNYVTQPGYRYFILFELLIFRGLYRIVPFLNIALLIVVIYSFQRVIHEVVITDKFRKAILLLVVLFTPFAIKNLLMGMPEWLAALLLMAFSYFYIVRKNELLAVFLLGLVPFFRQNLLITTLLLFCWLLIQSKQKLKVSIVFFLVLLLPVYHNLYYAGKWKFFSVLLDYPFLKYTVDRKVSGFNFELVINNIIHYLGIDFINGKLEIIPIAILFLPFSAFLFFILFRFLHRPIEKTYFFLITMSTVGPAIFLANAYYPRFEFINVVVMAVGFCVLNITGNNARGLRSLHKLKTP